MRSPISGRLADGVVSRFKGVFKPLSLWGRGLGSGVVPGCPGARGLAATALPAIPASARGFSSVILLCLIMLYPLDPANAGTAASGNGEAESSAAEAPVVPEEPVSEAERLLWLTDQVTTLPVGTLLRYRYDAKSFDEDPIEDEVDLEIISVNEDGSRGASVYFFTGDRNRNVEPFERSRGNPVLGIYLQDDVYRLEERAGGSWRYFHRKVKKALAHDATIEDIVVDFDGRKVPARRVSFQPFQYDELRDRFEEMADKRYSIIVSDQIPGSLYEIHTLVPGKEEGSPPLHETRLRLDVVKGPEAAAGGQP